MTAAGGAGALAGYRSGKNAIKSGIDRAANEADIEIAKPGGLSEERARLEKIVADKKNVVDAKNQEFKDKLKGFQDMADNISVRRTKDIDIEDLNKILKDLTDDAGEFSKKHIIGIDTGPYKDWQKSTLDLAEHENKIQRLKEEKIKKARKLLENAAIKKTVLGGVGAGTLGYGAYNMYKRLQNKD